MSEYKVVGKKQAFFCQRSYAYEAQTTGESKDAWRARVTGELSLDRMRSLRAGIKSVVYIFHDRDLDDEGNPKELHVHFVVEFDNGYGITQEKAMELFQCSREKACQAVRSRVDSYRYLTHTSESAMNQRKQRYSEADVVIGVDQAVESKYGNSARGLIDWYYDVCSSRVDRRAEAEEKERKQDAMAKYKTAVERGQVSADEVFSMIEDDEACEKFTIHDAQRAQPGLEQAEQRFFKRLVLDCESMCWPKTTIYISGDGGEGKTTLTRAIANHYKNSRGVHEIAAKGKDTSFDMADGYNMQAVSVANEVRGNAFGIDQFCAVFDPKYGGKVNSRNSDKMYLPNVVIINNSVSLEQFIFDMCIGTLERTATGRSYAGNEKEKILRDIEEHSPYANKIMQVRRRVAIKVVIRGGYLFVGCRLDWNNPAHIYVYDSPEEGKEPYFTVGSMQYNANDDRSVEAAVDLVDKAIACYYQWNQYKVTPLDSGWTTYRGGDKVELPGEDDVVKTHRETMVTYAGMPQMTIPEFNTWLERGVDALEKYASPEVQAGSIKGIYQQCSFVNGAFYHSRNRAIIRPDLMNRFRDIRNSLIDQDKWIKRRVASGEKTL